MFERNKWILAFIIGTMTFSGLAILDEIAIKVIFSASGLIAYSIVGSLLGTAFITSRADAGQARMGLFVFLVVVFLAIYVAIINFITWLVSFPIWVYVLIFAVSAGLIALRIYLNKKAEKEYEDNHYESKIKDIELEVTEIEEVIDEPVSSIASEKLKSIYQLLEENKDQDIIYVERVDNKSPGLQYVKVNRKALTYPTFMGYLKFDNAGVFREIFNPDEEIWKLYM